MTFFGKMSFLNPPTNHNHLQYSPDGSGILFVEQSATKRFSGQRDGCFHEHHAFAPNLLSNIRATTDCYTYKSWHEFEVWRG